MNWFKKKKEQEQEKKLVIPELPHKCVFKDMPWYMEVEYSGRDKTASYKIIEPYICINGCGKRIDKILEQESWQNIDSSTRDEYYDKIRKRYKKYLKPRAVVEDMINNILLVKDPGHLEMIEKIRGIPHRNCGTSAEMKQVKETKFKINIPEREKSATTNR